MAVVGFPRFWQKPSTLAPVTVVGFPHVQQKPSTGLRMTVVGFPRFWQLHSININKGQSMIVSLNYLLL